MITNHINRFPEVQIGSHLIRTYDPCVALAGGDLGELVGPNGWILIEVPLADSYRSVFTDCLNLYILVCWHAEDDLLCIAIQKLGRPTRRIADCVINGVIGEVAGEPVSIRRPGASPRGL